MQIETGADHSTRWASLWATGERVLTARRGSLALAAIVLSSLVFRVYMSLHASLWLDEVTTHQGVLLPWGKVLSGPSQAHPPLMYVLVKLAITAFGDSEAGLRSVSLFFGCVLLVAIYELCRELGLSIPRSQWRCSAASLLGWGSGGGRARGTHAGLRLARCSCA